MPQNRPSMQPSPPKMANLNTQSNFGPNNGQQSSIAATSGTNLTQSASSPQQQPANKPWIQIAKVCQILGLTYDSVTKEIRLPANSQLNSSSNPLYSHVEAIPSMDLDSSSSWHQQVGQELRSYLLHKILAVFHPPSTGDQNGIKTEPMSNAVIEKVQKVESQAYRMAKSKEEYYQLIAKWIHNIQRRPSVEQKMRRKVKVEEHEMGIEREKFKEFL